MPVATLLKLLSMGILKPGTLVHPLTNAGFPGSMSSVNSFPTALYDAGVFERMGYAYELVCAVLSSASGAAPAFELASVRVLMVSVMPVTLEAVALQAFASVTWLASVQLAILVSSVAVPAAFPHCVT